MDKDTRSLLQRATQAARRTLEDELRAQLEGVYDIRPDGTVAAEAGRHLNEDGVALRVRAKLVAAVEHHRASGRRPAEAVAALSRECAFTTLNRLVALKMLEARGIVQPCVSQGPLSSGFKEFCGLAPGLVDLPDQGYRLYLDSLFDEIGREVRVLFDRRDPASLLWPRKTALDELLGLLNDPALAGVWGEDETIGWVYQYFNGEDERRQMRAESQAPRNSRELAVRNQFFTPRYVVEFLTDNTLGRTWVEQRRGDTRLTETCRYLVRRPGEGFGASGEAPQSPEVAPAGSLKAPQSPEVASTPPAPVRAKKDPRDLRVLDPACGSGHFLLYSFDLLLVIYEEAWADADSPKSEATGHTLSADYPSLAALRRALPGLVLRHNLYGVDIDPRAAQIAAFALWMRAQRAWKAFGLKRAERPLVTRTNVVVAEPMPGEPDLLNELCQRLDKPVADIVRAVFAEMKLAGEAGMLLRVEDTVRRGVERLTELGGLYADQDARRWENLEAKVYAALRTYAESVGGVGYRRRLFADDAAQGFAFIELCRQTYDVVLMNPPFGGSASAFKDRLAALWPRSKQDVYAAFVERGVRALPPGGYLGAITSRTGFFLKSFQAWREEVILKDAPPSVVADLGAGVLDSAMVETAAYCLQRSAHA
ncbi:BREX-1 system adenine-specific DNA-methyltransferase PglX [Myxococcota bacterium]|nr:BREX-1 system adenine-specific DNA-methyltransferase PglX [Myxococcota bacterium]